MFALSSSHAAGSINGAGKDSVDSKATSSPPRKEPLRSYGKINFKHITAHDVQSVVINAQNMKQLCCFAQTVGLLGLKCISEIKFKFKLLFTVLMPIMLFSYTSFLSNCLLSMS